MVEWPRDTSEIGSDPGFRLDSSGQGCSGRGHQRQEAAGVGDQSLTTGKKLEDGRASSMRRKIEDIESQLPISTL